ncbi:MAG TPA: GNAT family N-acetyltransferase [Cryomorphaceae bacterium]|nr:GNAT family N-acetyltransferase [Cryomorphaceae bacterium]
MVRLQFQKATITDLPLLYELAEEIWIPAFAPLFSETQLRALYSGMYNDELLTKWLAEKRNELYFLRVNDNAIGYSAIEKHSEFLKLDKIYIHPSFQGKGLGRAAMIKIEEITIDSGLSEIHLRVNRENHSAISFYQNLNFRIIESIDFPGPQGFLYEDFLMKKVLFKQR